MNTIAQVEKPRLQIENIFWISLVHFVAIFIAPFYFTWDALVVCLVVLFTVSPIGVTMTYHRLLSHRAFEVPKWLEYTLAVFGTLSAQGPILLWIAEHRLHHRYSDHDDDPHDSRKGFWFAHMTHLFRHKEFEDREELWMKYVPEFASQPFYRFLNKYSILIALTLPIGLYIWGGLPYLLWGGFVRVALMLHITWFVNSATHLWGYRNYKTDDNSRNIWWVAMLAAGEGWHNNHHYEMQSAAHGHKWWEFDFTWLLIRGLEMLGLAKNVKRPMAWKKSKLQASASAL